MRMVTTARLLQTSAKKRIPVKLKTVSKVRSSVNLRRAHEKELRLTQQELRMTAAEWDRKHGAGSHKRLKTGGYFKLLEAQEKRLAKWVEQNRATPKVKAARAKIVRRKKIAASGRYSPNAANPAYGYDPGPGIPTWDERLGPKKLRTPRAVARKLRTAGYRAVVAWAVGDNGELRVNGIRVVVERGKAKLLYEDETQWDRKVVARLKAALTLVNNL